MTHRLIQWLIPFGAFIAVGQFVASQEVRQDVVADFHAVVRRGYVDKAAAILMGIRN